MARAMNPMTEIRHKTTRRKSRTRQRVRRETQTIDPDLFVHAFPLITNKEHDMPIEIGLLPSQQDSFEHHEELSKLLNETEVRRRQT